MKAPPNTTRQVNGLPLGALLDAMTYGASEYIERQEAQGQGSFVGSDTLPTDFGQYDLYDSKAILESYGIVFLEPVPNDDLFRYVKLPAGWKKASMDHSMWSKLFDDQGRERASIFYKAAFYDRRAFLSLTPRFKVGRNFERDDYEQRITFDVHDSDKLIHSVEVDMTSLPEKYSRAYNDVLNAAQEEAVKWLDARYPHWRNPGAYWE